MGRRFVEHLGGIWHQFNSHRRLQVGGIIVLIFLSSLAELVSLGAAFPFLATMAAPTKVYEHPAAAGFTGRGFGNGDGQPIS